MVGQTQVWDVLCLGEALVQLDQRDDGVFSPDVSGDALQVAIAVAQMGGLAAIATRIGCDEFGDAVLTALDSAQVDITLVQRDLKYATSHMFRHSLGSIMHRQFCRAGTAGGYIRSDDLTSGRIAQARVVHATGITLGLSPMMRSVAEFAAAQAHVAGGLVSFYPCYQPDLWSEEDGRSCMMGHLRACDIAFVRSAEAQFLLGVADPHVVIDRLMQMGLQMVVLTCDEGAWVSTASGRSLARQTADRLPGALTRQEVFIGTYLSGLTAGDNLHETAVRALAAADIAAARGGAARSIPRLADLGCYPETAISPSAARVQPMEAAP